MDHLSLITFESIGQHDENEKCQRIHPQSKTGIKKLKKYRETHSEKCKYNLYNPIPKIQRELFVQLIRSMFINGILIQGTHISTHVHLYTF